VSAIFSLFGNQDAFLTMYDSQKWFLVKLLIAISGVMLLFDIKSQTKDNKGRK
jgi:hypothetical protein